MKKYKTQIIIFGISILATIFACYPYLNKLNITAHDILFHVSRIQQIALGLSNGHFPVLIHTGLVEGLGYGNSLFYPELFLYFPAILINFGISTLSAYKIFILATTFATFWTMFITTKKIFKKNEVAVISTLLYTFSLYRIVDVYTRAAVGEILAFVFLPIVVLGCYELLLGDKKKWWILPLGIFGMVNSHIISFGFSIGVIFFFLIINIKKYIVEDKSRIKYIFLSGIISILMILSVFLPMVEQISENDYKVFTNGTSEELTQKSLIPTQVFMNEYQYNFAAVENNLINNQMNFGIGILLLVVPCFVFLIKFKDKKEKNFIIQLSVMGILALIATTQIFPWQYFRFLNFIQIPWRLNTIITLCFSMVGAYSLYYAMKEKKEFMYIFAIIIAIVTSGYLDKIQYTDSIQDRNAVYDQIGKEEYLPSIGCNRNDNYVFDIDNKEITYEYKKENKDNKIEFEVTNTKNSKRINVPLIYYKGYKAYIENDGNKQELPVKMNLENGLIELDNENKQEGKITVKYEMTVIQKTSYFIFYFTFICVIIYLIYIAINKSKKTKIKKLGKREKKSENKE